MPTVTIFPDYGEGGSSVDGWVVRYVTSETFAQIRSRTATDNNAGDVVSADLEAATGTSNTFKALYRGIMSFDTSSIPAGSLITSATLSLWPANIHEGMGTTPVHIVGVTMRDPDYINDLDYNNVGSTSFASASSSGMSFAAYTNFSLNSSGLANINAGGVSAFALVLGWDLAGSFTGSWSSGAYNTFDFYDTDTAPTGRAPKLTVTYSAVISSRIGGTLKLGGGPAVKATHFANIGGSLALSGGFTVQKDVAPVAGKEYVYRVYDQTGTYIGVWKDPLDVPEFTQRLNTPGTTMTVRLPRSANTTIEKRDVLVADDGTSIISDDGQQIAVAYVTNNTVGEDTDVDLNYTVDVYVHYGGFDTFESEDGQTLVSDAGEEILFPYGAPLGRRIFSGWVMDYAATYGDEDSLTVTLASHGSELANAPITSGSATTVTYGATDHGQVIRGLLAMNAAWHPVPHMGLGTSTVSNTGVTITPTFRLNTVLEGIEDVFNQSPTGWYWYGNVAENEVYFRQKSSTPDHTFVLGAHISSLKISRSLENLKNDLYFVGGDPGTGVFYKHDTAATAGFSSPFNRKGLERQTDRRVWVLATYQKRRDKLFSRFGDAIYTTTVTIPSEVYDIESIDLGQVVGFANFGNFIDALQLQVVSKQYSAYTVTLELGEQLDTQADIIDDTSSTLQDEQYTDIPSTPS